MVANITVAVLAVIAFGAGIFGIWLTSHNQADDASDEKDSKEN